MNTEHYQQQDQGLFRPVRADDLKKKPGKYKELKRRIYIIKEVFGISLVVAEGPKIEDVIHQGISQYFDHQGHNKVHRDYPQIGRRGIPVTIKQTDGQRQHIEDQDRYAGYGINV
jgi:hypothetical protein